MNDFHNDDNIFDSRGFRYNVGIILLNQANQVFWGKRVGQDAWQFPQGGIAAGESAEDAMYRELFEETGLFPEDVELLAVSTSWLSYRLPLRFRRPRREGQVQCIGQKQKWYLVRLCGSDDAIKLDANGRPEFDHWCWIGYWQPALEVVAFKREVYRRALEEFSHRLPEVAAEKPVFPDEGGTKRKKAPSFARRRR